MWAFEFNYPAVPPSGVASMRLTSLTSSFLLMAEIFVKLGEQICACEGSLDTGVLALRPMGGLRAELLCLLASSLARAGVLPASSCTKAFTLVLARPSGRWNKTNVRRSLAAPLLYLSAHGPSCLFAMSGHQHLVVVTLFGQNSANWHLERNLLCHNLYLQAWWLLCGLKVAEWWEACEQFNL